MAIDAVLVGTVAQSTGATTTTGSGTTTTGSTFVICIDGYFNYNVDSVADSKGNTYTQVGTKNTNGSVGVWMYYCENGTGGSGHTATVTPNGGGMAATIALIEITGAATASYDQTADADDAAAPYTITSPTLSQADEVVITVIGCDAPSDRTVSSSNTTMIATATNGSTYLPFGVSKLVVSATTAVTPSFTTDSDSITTAMKLATFKAAAGGSSAPPRSRLTCLGVG